MNVLVLLGSLRADSDNLRLAQAAIAALPEGVHGRMAAGLESLPFYSEDLDGPAAPASVRELRATVAEADAILLVTPEYNGSIPAVVKNAIDWASRPYGKNSWAGKTVAVTGTSGGAVGTAVSQNELRMILTNLAGVVVGSQVFVTFKDDLIDAQHNVTNEATRGFLQGFVDNFAKIAGKLAA